MVIVCQTCGDVGISEVLEYCNKCHLFAVHRYCLDTIPKEEEVGMWSCEQCVSSVAKQSSLKKLFSHPSRTSERVKKPKMHRAANIFQNLERKDTIKCLVAETEAEVRMSNGAFALQPCNECLPPEPEQPLGDCFPLSEDDRSPRSCSVNSDRDQGIRKQRRLIIEDGDSGDEEAEHVKVKQLKVDLDTGDAPVNILAQDDGGIAPEQPLGDCFPQSEDDSSPHSFSMNSDRDQRIKKPRRLIIEDGDSCDEKVECFKFKQLKVDLDISNAPVGILLQDDKSRHSCNANSDRDQEIRKRRSLIVEDGGSRDEEVEYVNIKKLKLYSDARDAPVSILPHLPSLESSKYIYAQPIIHPAWSGCFGICNEKIGTVVAHLSSKACLKVFEQAHSLQPLLCMDVHLRLDVWPKSFSVSAPTDENIALYFFPESGRDEKTFDELVHQIIDLDLALKAVVDNAELLIFSSCQLPQQYWRFCGKYYLWGVFRRRQVSLPPKSAAHLLIQNISTGCVVSMSAVGKTGRSDPAKSQRMRSPLSPLSTSSEYRSDSPHYPLPPKAKICSSEFASSHDLESISSINTSKSGNLECNPENLRAEEEERIEKCNLNLSNLEALPFPDSFDVINKENSGLSTACLELFPLRVEDMAIVTKGGGSGRLNLDLGL